MTPEGILCQNARGQFIRFSNCAAEAIEKPDQPLRDIHSPFLCGFQYLVVALAFFPDLRRHAVETLRAVLQPRERHFRDGAGDSSIAILEGMYGHEVEVSQAGLDKRLSARRAVFVPGQKCFHFGADRFGCGSLEVKFLFSFRTGNDFHSASSPSTCFYFAHPAATRRKQRCMPAEYPLFG